MSKSFSCWSVKDELSIHITVMDLKVRYGFTSSIQGSNLAAMSTLDKVLPANAAALPMLRRRLDLRTRPELAAVESLARV